jgi:hypothetical protein
MSAMENNRPKRESKQVQRYAPSTTPIKRRKLSNSAPIEKKIKEKEKTHIQKKQSLKKRQPSVSIDTIKHLAAQASDGLKHSKSFYTDDGIKHNTVCHLEHWEADPDCVLTPIPSYYSEPVSTFATYHEEALKHLALHPTYCVEDLSNNNRPGNEVFFLNSNRELIFEDHTDGILLPSTTSSKIYSQSPYKNLYR